MKVNKQQYAYFLHGTHEESEETISNFFNEGLISYRGNDMYSTMAPITSMDFQHDNLEGIIKSYGANHGFESVFLIKIPIEYTATLVHTNHGNTMDFPIPLWIPTSEKDYHGHKISIFCPHLIQGVYNVEKGFITNPNYCPVYNPNGMQYDERQITNLKTEGRFEWAEFASARSKDNIIPDYLKEYDENKKTFNSLMESYKKSFEQKGVKIATPQNYIGGIHK